jgi:hypothetical protein
MCTYVAENAVMMPLLAGSRQAFGSEVLIGLSFYRSALWK